MGKTKPKSYKKTPKARSRKPSSRQKTPKRNLRSSRPRKQASRKKTPKRKTSVRKLQSQKSSKKNQTRKSPEKLKLVKIVKSPIKTKKYRAYFNDGKHTDFGAKGYQNYGGVGKERHLDEDRKKRYIERHKKKEDWTNPKKAGTLSRYVLWNKESFRKSVEDYKKRFKL
jgi:Family of unknown function (DUF5754)